MRLKNYSFSFTTCSIRRVESLKLVDLYTQQPDWNAVRSVVIDKNVLQQRTLRSSIRLYQELSSRLKCLSREEFDILSSGTKQEQNQILWLATCRRYDFIYDFAVEVVREQFLNLRWKLEPVHFDTFWTSKSLINDELDAVANSTRVKCRQVIFKMLKEVELLDDEGQIQMLTYSDRLLATIVLQSPENLVIYPVSEEMIRMLKA